MNQLALAQFPPAQAHLSLLNINDPKDPSGAPGIRNARSNHFNTLIPFFTAPLVRKQELILISVGSQIFIVSLQSKDSFVVEEVFLDFSCNGDGESSFAACYLEGTSFYIQIKKPEPPASSEKPRIITVSTSVATWSVDGCLVQLDFSSETGKLMKALAPSVKPSIQSPASLHPIGEVIYKEYIAHLNVSGSTLQLLNRADRCVLSTVRLANDLDWNTTRRSLIWNSEASCIIVILCSEDCSSLTILKYPLVHFAPPSNGSMIPMVAWSDCQIFAHRAPICSNWFHLKGSEVWDVIDSQVGRVEQVCISADSSVMFVGGSEGLSVCDFAIRRWHRLPFKRCKFPRWLGAARHLVGVFDDVLLIFSSTDHQIHELKISKNVADLRFLDVYNEWQLILHLVDNEIMVLSVDWGATKPNPILQLIERITIPPPVIDHDITQMAFVDKRLYIQRPETLSIFHKPSDEAKTMTAVSSINCNQFIFLSSGHLLTTSRSPNQEALLHFKEEKFPTGLFGRQAIYQQINCSIALSFVSNAAAETDFSSSAESTAFSLRNGVTCAFLLPAIFSALKADPNAVTKTLLSWHNDPLYVTALEFILLKSLGDSEALKLLDQIHFNTHGANDANDLKFARALASISRKIEVHEASHQLFSHLPNFTPEQVAIQLLASSSVNDALVFLPYLAKSYFEDVEARKVAITSILSAIFARRAFYPKIPQIREYLGAFSDLLELMNDALNQKLRRLWNTGRILKAFALLQYSDKPGLLSTSPPEQVSLMVLKIDVALSSSPDLVSDCINWLQTNGLNAIADQLQSATEEQEK